MRPGSLSTLLLLALVPLHSHTGSSAAEITVSSTREPGGGLAVTCRLRGDDNVTVSQVNWVRQRGGAGGPSNRTALGTFHPDYGTYVAPELDGTEILGSVADRSSTLRLPPGGAVEEEEKEGGQLCCVFHTFPLGNLERCADSHTAAAQEGEAVEPHGPKVEQWALLIGGCLVCFLSTIATVYVLLKCCCTYCCRRRKVFEVQTCLTDQHSNTEEIPEEPSQVSLPRQTPPLPAAPLENEGFSPAKLYAKIKLDLLYGRLWKSYQGPARPWTPRPPAEPLQAQTPLQAPPQRVYSLLGEVRPAAQEEETGSRPPDRDPQPDPQVTPAEERSEVNPADLLTPIDGGSGVAAENHSPGEGGQGNVMAI